MEAHQAGEVRIVSGGNSFELWKGPKGTMRLDWTRRGAVRTIVDGHGYQEYGPASIRRWNDALRIAPRVCVFADFGDMASYDSQLRVDMQSWGARHRNDIELVYLFTQSKLVAMGAAVGNLAMGGIMKVFSKREEFDFECQKLGLILNPPLVPGPF